MQANLRGQPAGYRARVAFARLRKAGIEPRRLLAIYLGNCALIKDDFGAHHTLEFKIVQAAKAIHRLASGTHRSWEMLNPPGLTSAQSCTPTRDLRGSCCGRSERSWRRREVEWLSKRSRQLSPSRRNFLGSTHHTFRGGDLLGLNAKARTWCAKAKRASDYFLVAASGAHMLSRAAGNEKLKSPHSPCGAPWWSGFKLSSISSPFNADDLEPTLLSSPFVWLPSDG